MFLFSTHTASYTRAIDYGSFSDIVFHYMARICFRSIEWQDFVRFTATVGAFAGLGLLAGPMVSKVIMRYADPKYCFLAATIFLQVPYFI